MRLSLNISPCPNDTFSFDALVNGRIDTRGYSFEVAFADIEELNARVTGEMAGRGTHSHRTALAPAFPVARNYADISKISYAILPTIHDRWELLDSGSALGYGNGPVLVARRGFDRAALSDFSVAVPGLHTTANLLMQKLFPQITHRRPLLFSEIAEAVARGDFEAGVLIHEGRFTYRDHGLELVADLGGEWEKSTSRSTQIAKPQAEGPDQEKPVSRGLPLPLGAIVASRELQPGVRRDVEELIRESVEYAFAHPTASRDFVKAHARELDDSTIESHIALFVNDNSLTLSSEARAAIGLLTGVAI